MVLEKYGIEKDDIYSGSRKSRISEARSFFCYLFVRELGESMTSPAKRLRISPAVGYAEDRRKIAAKARDILLKDK